MKNSLHAPCSQRLPLKSIYFQYPLKNLLRGSIDTHEALILLIPMYTIKEIWRFWIGSGSILTSVSTRRHSVETFQNILAHRF